MRRVTCMLCHFSGLVGIVGKFADVVINRIVQILRLMFCSRPSFKSLVKVKAADR